MEARMFTGSNGDRQYFIGGSDARIIMGGDEEALIRLWQEKRGEAKPVDLSGELIVQLGLATEALNLAWYERNSGHRVGQRQARKRPCIDRLDGGDLGRPGRGDRGGVRSQIHAAVVVFGTSGSRKAHGAVAAQHDGGGIEDVGAFHHHRRRQMGGNRDFGRPGLPDRHDVRGAGVLARGKQRRAACACFTPSRPGPGSRRSRSST